MLNISQRYLSALLMHALMRNEIIIYLTFFFHVQDQHLYTKAQIDDQVCVALGGRIAEDLTFGRITTGARDDLDRVTKMLYAQVTKYGMGNSVGAVSYQNARGQGGMSLSQYSEKTAEKIDMEVRELVKQHYERTKKLLLEKKDKIELLAEELLKKEVLSRKEVLKLLGPRPHEEANFALDMYDSPETTADAAAMADAAAAAAAEGEEAKTNDKQ